jgi:Tfp pilus assembly protein PilF
MKRRGFSVASLLVLAACAAPPAKTTTARHEAAIEANRRAEAYLRHGELENAARSYREALRLSQSLEDADGIAANAINVSIVRQRQGRFGDARASLGVILEQPDLHFSSARLAEASLRHALLDLDEGRYAAAGKWLSQSLEHCAGRCGLLPAIHNTRAQLALKAGLAEEGAAAARSAHDAAHAANDRTELANALRLLGIAALQAGDFGTARPRLEEALALDRELGVPRRIALDLLALGRAAERSGDRAAARAYYARALAVSEADRDTSGTAEARAMLEAATGK